MNTDEVRLVKNIIMNIGSVMDETEFTTMHPVTRETDDANIFTFEESLDFIRTEFMRELQKRKELLDKISELQEENEQLERDLKAYRSFYPMTNEVCRKCMFADECLDAYRFVGKRFCSSFKAKLEMDGDVDNG